MSEMLIENKSPMYKLDPIVSFENNLILPTCMYRVANIHGRNVCEGVENNPSSNNCGVIQQVMRLLQKPLEITTMIEERQKKLLQQLENLRSQMLAMKQNINSSPQQSANLSEKSDLPKDIVLIVDPKNPPYYLFNIQKLLKIKITCHTHSSITELSEGAKEYVKKIEDGNPTKWNLNIVLIWKPVGISTKLMTSPTMPVMVSGDVNILRYLILALPSELSYHHLKNSWKVDSMLDICHRLQWVGSGKERQQLLKQLSDKLGKNQWLYEGSHSLADLAVWSAVRQGGFANELPANMKGWFKKCDNTYS